MPVSRSPAGLWVGYPLHVFLLTVWPARLTCTIRNQGEVPDLFHSMSVHALLSKQILPVPSILLSHLAVFPVHFAVIATFHIVEQDLSRRTIHTFEPSCCLSSSLRRYSNVPHCRTGS